MHLDEIRNDILALLMKGLMYHSMVCIFYNVASAKSLRMDLMLLMLYIPLLLYTVIRRLCRKFFVFLLFHILVSGVFLLVFPGLEQRVVIGGCVCLMAFFSIRARITEGNGQEECPPVSSLVLFVVVYLAAWQSARTQIMQISCYEAFLFLILFVIHRNLANLSAFLNENERTENLPKDQMKAMNHLLLGVFVLFFMAGMLFLDLPSSYLFRILAFICRLLVCIIVEILYWIFRKKTSHPEMSTQDAMRETMPALEAGETSALAQLLDQFFAAAAGIALGAAAIYLLVRSFYSFYQRFYEKHKEPDDESEFIWKQKDVLEHLVRIPKKTSFLHFLSPDQKIRRLYKKSIQDRFGTSEIVPPELTPTELESFAETAVITEKVALYEKARYSQYHCEKKEVEQMKLYIKRK